MRSDRNYEEKEMSSMYDEDDEEMEEREPHIHVAVPRPIPPYSWARRFREMLGRKPRDDGPSEGAEDE
jgi:hypothetical protein